MSDAVLNYETPRTPPALRVGTMVLLGVLVLTLLVCLADGAGGVLMAHAWHLYAAGIPIDPWEISLTKSLGNVGFLWWPAMLLAMAALIPWMAHAHSFLRARFPERLRFSRWEVLIGWVLPRSFVIRPFEVMKEIYAVSRGIAYDTFTPICGCWWGFLLMGVLSSLAKYLAFSHPQGERVDLNIAYGRWTAVCDLPYLISGLCLMIVVYRIDRAQARLPQPVHSSGN